MVKAHAGILPATLAAPSTKKGSGMKMRTAVVILGLAGLGYAAWSFGWLDRLRPPGRLAEGTSVPALLLTELTAGESKVESPVFLAAAKPILAEDGRLLIEKGSIIEGRLATSRSGGLLERMAGSEPLLELEMCRVKAADGSWIPLGRPEGPDGPVRVPLPRPKFDAAAAAGDLIARAKDSDLAKAMQKGWSLEQLKDLDWIDQIRKSARELDLPRVQAATTEALIKARKELDQAGRGDFSRLKDVDLAESAQLWRELESSARRAGAAAQDALRGPARRAGAGTPVQFAVSRSAEVRAP
jgi:hypothetical protein